MPENAKPASFVNIAFDSGVVAERTRIIKLLEKQKKIYNSPKYSTTGGLIEEFVLDNAIALIKGENK